MGFHQAFLPFAPALSAPRRNAALHSVSVNQVFVAQASSCRQAFRPSVQALLAPERSAALKTCSTPPQPPHTTDAHAKQGVTLPPPAALKRLSLSCCSSQAVRGCSCELYPSHGSCENYPNSVILSGLV